MEGNKPIVKNDNSKLIDKLSIITRGMTNNLSTAATDILNKNLADLENKIDSFTNSSALGARSDKQSILSTLGNINNTENNSRMMPDLDGDLSSIRNYYEKYYSTLKDYESIPSLIPQVTRVLNFLRNEIVSPDIHNKKTFVINCEDSVVDEIECILEEHQLYSELPKIVDDRLRVGKTYYLVQGYGTLFNMVSNMTPNQMVINETIKHGISEVMSSRIHNDVIKGDVTIPINETINNNRVPDMKFDLKELNIKVEYGGAIKDYRKQLNAINSQLNETYKYSAKSLIKNQKNVSLNDFILAESVYRNGNDDILNESIDSAVDKEKIINISKTLANKKNLRRCSIIKLDPGRVFPIKVSNRILGYFYYEDDKTESGMLSFNELLSKHIKRAKIGKDAMKVAEDKVINKISKYIIENVKENLDIEDMADLDLFADYLINSEITKGNKTFRFYHADDIIDISRTDGSLLINSVYQAKLLAILMHNNIVTKLTKGRDREIFTINMGASASVAPYLYNAMEIIASGNDGIYRAMNGPIAKILNPYQNSSIIIPSEDGSNEFIKADIIQGQDVDMDLDIIKFLLNNIITSYGVDPGILDLLNNSVDFAKSLTMINKEMLILNINEQADTLPGFKDLILAVLYEEGSDLLRQELSSDKVEVKLFEPKSLILDIVADETNNARSFAELICDVHPILNTLEEENELSKKIAVYKLMQDFVSSNFGNYDNTINDVLSKQYVDYMKELNVLSASRAVKVVNDDEENSEDEYGAEDGYGDENQNESDQAQEQPAEQEEEFFS